MAKKPARGNPPPAAVAQQVVFPATLPSPASLAALAGLGVASALWALFLWAQLLLSRAGGTPFCAASPGADCSAVWDAAFARAVHALTGLPIAGWGLAWGLVALTLPLVTLWHAAEGRPAIGMVSAIRITAAAGVVTVFVLLSVSAAERTFCLGCLVSDALVGGYAGIALFGWQKAGLPQPRRGLMLAVATTATAFLLLLYPGLHTPRGVAESGRSAVAEVAKTTPLPGSLDPERDRLLGQFVSSLAPELRQTLSDSLAIYRRSPPTILGAPRALLGAAEAPVRITEFTDVLCDHCADLHETFESLRERLPPGSFSVEPRQFPLDGECNPRLQPRGGDSVRCVGAKARICLEQNPRAFDFSGALFTNQKSLTRARVFEIAATYTPRATLEACIESPATRKLLEDDIAYASRFDADGTPIVLVNGRLGTSFGPFLYAMVLTRGADAHPAFDPLPPANPKAHIH